MKKETMERIIAGEKKTLKVMGYTYHIGIVECADGETIVELEPHRGENYFGL